MWFIFPQIAGLGSSPVAQHYAIRDRSEARAYLEHAVLGPRLVECTETLLALTGVTAAEVFGHPDDLKLRSSATLFAEISQPGCRRNTSLAADRRPIPAIRSLSNGSRNPAPIAGRFHPSVRLLPAT